MNYCRYYQAYAYKEKIWFIIGHIKSHDNIVFHRTMDGTNDVLEFFVPESFNMLFLSWLETYKKAGLIKTYEEKPNRLSTLL